MNNDTMNNDSMNNDTTGGARYDAVTPALVMTALRVTNPAVTTEALRWAGGTRWPVESAEMVRKHPGKVILVVGHSNTIMPYVAALGGPTRADLCDHEYDGLYTMIIDGQNVRLVESHYGPPNPAPTAPCAKTQMRP